MNEFLQFDWNQVLVITLQILFAYVLALPLAWDRERSQIPVGLRTFPLVAVASCGFVLMGAQIAAGNERALARVIQGLMTGIGFVGGGAIIKDKGTVQGTATAVSIWTTGAIGAAVAVNMLEIAVVLSVVNFLTFRYLTPLKERIEAREDVEEQEGD